MGKNILKLSGIQFNCVDSKAENLKKAVYLAKIAIEKGANIICFQELMNSFWFPKTSDYNNFQLAEDLNGETITTFVQIAKESNVVIICPIFERTIIGVYYNTAVVIDNTGQIIGKYRKMHIPFLPLWEEKFYFKPGDTGFPVIKTIFGKIGIQLCWDNFFPEGSRILALKGVDIIFAPTAAAFDSHFLWERVITANAITNGIYIFRINRCGSEDKLDFYGKTFCVSPSGELLFEPTGLNDGISLVDINLDLIRQTRHTYPFLRDRRPDAYDEILGEDTSSF